MKDVTEESDREVGWPYASLLLFGYFGSGTEAGKALARQTTVALVLLLFVGVFGIHETGPLPGPAPLWAVVATGAVAFIAFAYSRYLGALDELSRVIQLKAFAVAYGSAMTLLVGIWALGLALNGEPFPWTPLAVLAAEPIRGLALALVARRYE